MTLISAETYGWIGLVVGLVAVVVTSVVYYRSDEFDGEDFGEWVLLCLFGLFAGASGFLVWPVALLLGLPAGIGWLVANRKTVFKNWPKLSDLKAKVVTWWDTRGMPNHNDLR